MKKLLDELRTRFPGIIGELPKEADESPWLAVGCFFN